MKHSEIVSTFTRIVGNTTFLNDADRAIALAHALGVDVESDAPPSFFEIRDYNPSHAFIEDGKNRTVGEVTTRPGVSYDLGRVLVGAYNNRSEWSKHKPYGNWLCLVDGQMESILLGRDMYHISKPLGDCRLYLSLPSVPSSP